MGNQQSAATAHKPRKYVHWKTAGVPSAPGAPEVLPADEAGAVTLRWTPSADGGAQLLGYQVECAQLGGGGGGAAWVRTQPPLVQRPELVLAGLAPPHRYRFRVAALNAVGLSAYSPPSDVLAGAGSAAPAFTRALADATVLEHETTEFRVEFTGAPPPAVAWFKDGYEIFSSRRTAIATGDGASVLVFHETLASDEGELRCTATNRAGHAVTRARLTLEAAPRLRYPRQYEDGLLYEVNETIFLKTTLVGKPPPAVEWRHDGRTLRAGARVDIATTDKHSVLKIHAAERGDRGEYQVIATNDIGSDSAAFLVTVTAPPEPPRRLTVARQVDRSVALAWQPPADDGGCRVGNYIVEYYRSGWDVWLKAVTSRKTSATLFELIEGSEYRFRVKAESPYGISAPSGESAPVRVPGRAADVQFLAVESRIISQALLREDGSEAEAAVTPAPRRRRAGAAPQRSRSNEFMLVLYPDEGRAAAGDEAEKRKSFQLDLEDALSPPPLSLSAPDLSARCTLPFKALRNAVSSTELLHERAMARFYKAVAMKEEQSANRAGRTPKPETAKIDIPIYNNDNDDEVLDVIVVDKSATAFKAPEILIKSDSFEGKETEYRTRQTARAPDPINGTQQSSFDEDYTASTVSTDGELSDDGSLNGDGRREHSQEDDTYSPRDKMIRPSPVKEAEDEEEETTTAKQIPLPDPNFVPKPILKRRDSDITEPKSPPEPVPSIMPQEKPKKEEKMTLLKKITKMPSQKPFTFSKILKKAEPAKELEAPAPKEIPKSNTIPDDSDKYNDERTVIDYYSNIVKEYGNQKKPPTQLYLNTDDLKNVAEKQQHERNIASKANKKQNEKPVKNNIKRIQAKGKTANTVTKPNAKAIKTKDKIDKPVENNKDNEAEKPETPPEKCTQKILLRTTERATIVIPIDYQGLEEKAKENVRSAIDYAVDLCLLLLAFWVYFFKDERLAIPFLILIIYRQLQETLFMNIPQWVRRHTPDWIKKKIS